MKKLKGTQICSRCGISYPWSYVLLQEHGDYVIFTGTSPHCNVHKTIKVKDGLCVVTICPECRNRDNYYTEANK